MLGSPHRFLGLVACAATIPVGIRFKLARPVEGAFLALYLAVTGGA